MSLRDKRAELRLRPFRAGKPSKARINARAEGARIPAQPTMQSYLFERLLDWLPRSRWRSAVVIKGGNAHLLPCMHGLSCHIPWMRSGSGCRLSLILKQSDMAEEEILE